MLRPERIVQFGEGNFLRGFADWMINRMNVRSCFDGSVVIVKPRPSHKASISTPKTQDIIALLRANHCRYQLNLQGLVEGKILDSIEDIDCVSRIINPYEEFADFVALAAKPSLRFCISNTTEAGIAFDPSCRLEDTPPASFPAKLTQLLWHRFRAFQGDKEKGLVIMPCELISRNGERLYECVMRYVDHWRESLGAEADEFRSWIDTACYFCTTLVDRIVTGSEGLVVKAEPYHLWVIEPPKALSIEQFEREFPAAKAGLNVVVTNDESPYHERKVALLNGPHTVLAPVAFLSGLDIVREACQHEVVGKYVRQVMYDELLPTQKLPKEELLCFADSVMERFQNPFVRHQLTSIMLNSFPKFQTRDLPGMKTYLEHFGTLPRGLVLGLAAICVYYRGGQRADGVPIQPNDDPQITALLSRLWQTDNVRQVAEGVLAAQELIWHEHGNLNLIPGLTDALAKDIESILSRGMLKALTFAIEH